MYSYNEYVTDLLTMSVLCLKVFMSVNVCKYVSLECAYTLLYEYVMIMGVSVCCFSVT